VEKPWKIADLRALDPLDAPDPSLDLIAVYTRDLNFAQQIRLDFLDIPETPAADIYIALDTKPGGSEAVHLSRLDLEALYPEGIRPTEIAYDLLLVIPAEGQPGVADILPNCLRNIPCRFSSPPRANTPPLTRPPQSHRMPKLRSAPIS
jgi:hypothetical protein